MKQCKECNVLKELTEFSKCGTHKAKIYYRGECRECNAKIQSSDQTAQIKYRNSEKGNAKKKAFKQTPKYRESQRTYEAKRIKEDKLFRLKKRIRDRTSKALKNKGLRKTSSMTEYIGCKIEVLKDHLEKQFTIKDLRAAQYHRHLD